MTPEMINVLIGLAGTLVPALIARLGWHIPNITPNPNPVPAPAPVQVPVADKEPVEFLGWLQKVQAGQVRLDPADVQVLGQIQLLLPAPTLAPTVSPAK